MDGNRKNTTFILYALFAIQLIGLLLSILNRVWPLLFSISAPVREWITIFQRIVNFGVVICLFLLPNRYRPAAILKGIWCISLVLPRFVDFFVPEANMELRISINIALNYLMVLLSLIAFYLEYFAHSAAVIGPLKKAWYILFACVVLGELFAVIVVHHLGNTIFSPNLNILLSIETINLANLISALPSFILQIAYLIILWKTIQNIHHQESGYGTEKIDC